MSVKILQKKTEIISFEIDTSKFKHNCDGWAKEFGPSIKVSPNGDGFVPDAFVKARKLKEEITKPLTVPFKYCPYCGDEFSVMVVAAIEKKEKDK